MPYHRAPKCRWGLTQNGHGFRYGCPFEYSDTAVLYKMYVFFFFLYEEKVSITI